MDERLDWATASHKVGVLSGQVAQLHAELIEVTARVIDIPAWHSTPCEQPTETTARPFSPSSELPKPRATLPRKAPVPDTTLKPPSAVLELVSARLTGPTAAAVEPGAPVAFHERYHTLSVGGRLFNTLAD